MERLRVIKERATADYDERKSAARFEVGLDDAERTGSAVDEELASKSPSAGGPPKKRSRWTKGSKTTIPTHLAC